jgi:RNA polymerase sigma factor (sigma-70 family)
MAADTPPERCRTCPFRCPGVCDAERSSAMYRARARMPQSPSDEALIRRHLAAGKTATASSCLGTLYERHHRYMVAAICRITGRFDVAPDLAQDVFLKALLHIDRFRFDASFTSWLYAIARNRCYDHAKSTAVRHEVSVDLGDVPPPTVENAALRTLEIEEARRILWLLLKDARLDAVERRAFRLHYGFGVPIDALTLRLALGNRCGAKARIVSARRKFSRAAERWRSSP